MPDTYIFADEAGCFEFAKNGRASRFFILCTVRFDSCAIGQEILELRRKLVWDKAPIGTYFHASTDKQVVRDAVFALIAQHKFTVHATIMEKSKAQPHIKSSRARFYQYGWLYHFRHGTLVGIPPRYQVLVTAASIGTKQGQAAFTNAVNDVARQTILKNEWATYFCPASSDPCLQVADYCAWAIQRKWERGDTRSYELIKDRIRREYDLWAHGKKHYY